MLTSPETLDRNHRGLCEDALALMAKKRHDYCGGPNAADPYHNLRQCEAMGLCSVEAGILIRMTDKLSRLATLIQHPAAVAGESIRDTCLDLLNYTVLLETHINQREMTHDSARIR
jgi:hypothetical protein